MSRLSVIREAAHVESKVITFAKLKRWLAWKFVSPGLRGPPDRMILKGIEQAVTHYQLWHGFHTRAEAEAALRVLIAMVIEFVETKAPDGKLEPWQERRQNQLRAFGFKVTTIGTPAAAEEWGKLQ